MKFYRNNEVDNEFSDSYASDDSSESNFDFEYDDLVNNFDERELSDESLGINTAEPDSRNEIYNKNTGFS